MNEKSQKEDTPNQQNENLQKFNRKQFLRLAGMGGAGLAAFPGLASGSTGKSGLVGEVETQPQPNNLPIISGAEFPIGAFFAPPPYQTTKERYHEMADAGFNFVITADFLYSQPVINLAMKVASQTGLKFLLLQDQRIWAMTHMFSISDTGNAGFLELSPKEFRALLKKVIKSYENHPSFAGINLFDEPARFGKLREVDKAFSYFVRLVQSCFPTPIWRGEFR
jgi:hypothetical protein